MSTGHESTAASHTTALLLQRMRHGDSAASALLASLLGPEAYQNSLIAARLGTLLVLAGRPLEAAAELAEAERLVIAHAGPDNHNALLYCLQRAQALSTLSEGIEQAGALVASLRAAAVASSDLAEALESRGLSELERALAGG